MEMREVLAVRGLFSLSQAKVITEATSTICLSDDALFLIFLFSLRIKIVL